MRSNPSRIVAAAAAVLLLAGVTGCGGGATGVSADAAAVRRTFTDYDAALVRSDYTTACTLLTRSVQQEIVTAAASLGGKTCPEAMGKALGTLTPAVRKLVVDSLGTARISNVRVTGDRATALLTVTVNGAATTKTYTATREGGGWKVDQGPTAA
jgi:hypothetical protein